MKNPVRFLIGMAVCSAVFAQQKSLPAGDAKAVVETACTTCHALSLITGAGHTPADWKLLVARVTAVQTALDHAGVDPASYDPRHPPAGLSAEDRGLIRRAAARLAASDTQQALANVQQEVLDVCHTPLEL